MTGLSLEGYGRELVTPNVLAAYLDEQGIAAARPDENTFRFSVPGGTNPLDGDQMVHDIHAVYQDDGTWSTAVALFRVPEGDSAGSSAIFRAILVARGGASSLSGPLIEDGLLLLGVDRARRESARSIVGDVMDVAKIATPCLIAGLRAATRHDVRLPLLGEDSLMKPAHMINAADENA